MLYRVLGLMSGTSLDGLDIAYCEFITEGSNIDFSIKKAVTVEYDSALRRKILDCESCSGEQLAEFSSYLGHYFGKQAKEFIETNGLTVDFISSHGQTVYHQPQNGFTLQIGDISAISAQAECTVVGNFRTLDVALNGQGAPLVPIGDELLFKDYECCLNIGGFSNISYREEGVRKAFDICPSNIVLNYLAEKLGKTYDADGMAARSGNINPRLCQELNNIPYYINNDKKSLAKEFVKQYVFPILDRYDISIEDKLASFTEHTADRISKNITGRTLVTGGGVYNKYLLERIRSKTNYELVVPDKLLIDYKEALIFAFLGLRRMRKEINCLASVTGARRDSCCGETILWI